MNQEAINRNLREKDSTESEFQRKVLESCRKYMKASAQKMSQYHDRWDANSYIYRGYRVADKEDVDAIKDGEPSKIIVPLTYAQIQTAISFIVSTFNQRDNIFEMKGMGPEDEKGSFAITTDLAYQMGHDKFLLKLYFWLLSAMKQGFGVVKLDWTEDYNDMRVAKQEPVRNIQSMMGAMFGKPMPTKQVEAVERVLAYQGNKITNISPYAFYPDPSVNIADFQCGMFVASEIEVSLQSLKCYEGDYYFGTDKIPTTIGKDLYKDRPRRVSGPFNKEQDEPNFLDGKGAHAENAIRMDIEINLSEKQATELWGGNLGTGTKPVKWLITVANDQKIIRFESKGNLHNKFGYEQFEFSPDSDSFFNPGLADTISELQNITTFFLNSHIVNVRKIIANRFIVDPSKIEMGDVKAGSLYIRTKGATGDIMRSIKQLETNDITRNHIADMETLMQLVQVITGVNENALGQYSGGRRSATEARNVNAGAAARLKMHATLAWMQGIEPLGRQILANTRQWRTKEVYNSIVGGMAIDAPYEQVILADPKKLAGGYDFIAYDATLPTDRQFQAGVLQELFTVLISNPNSMQLLNKDPMKLLEHIAKLYNIHNLRDFDLQPLGPPAAPVAPNAQVVPNQQAQQAIEAGAPPVDIAGEDVLASLAQ